MVGVDVEQVLAGAGREKGWRLYATSFEELRAAAVQRHVMYRAEFDDVMADERVGKYVAHADDGALVGLATLTNRLEAMPLISPEFFAARWPDHYAAGRVWYLGFIAIHPDHRGTGVFESVIEELWRPVRTSGGVAALDMCGRNEAIGLPDAISRTLEAFTPDVVTTALDQQSYWSFELAR
jgi:GNAT superfamily N-acetyltransferase